MRIIHFVDSLDPAMGGPPIAVASLASAQANLGHEVLIVTNEVHDSGSNVTEFLESIPGIQRVRILSFPNARMIDRVTGYGATRFIRKILKADDIVHIHGMWRPLLKVASHVARRVGAKYVFAPLGMLHPWALRQKHWKKQLALWLGWRTVIKNAAFIHALNKDEAGYIQGLDYLAGAFKMFSDIRPDVDFVVAGPDGGARDDFQRDIEKLGVKAKVHLVGPVYGDVKYSAMLGASCFCQPSRQEGFSMAATEAMACGLPVVLSGECHFPEVALARLERWWI